MKPIIFEGAAVAMVTPFKDNKINFEELKKLIDFNIENGTNAIVITGTSGEASTLTDAEHKEAIKFTIDYVNKRIPVIAGTGSNDTEYAVQLSKFAADAGADGLLLVTPYYNKCTQKGLIEHYTYIADNVDCPIILYNVPSRTGVNIEPETYLELSKHPNIVAAKEASGNFSNILKTIKLCGDNLTIYSGNDDQVVPLLSLGGKGVISVLSNVKPRETSDMCKLFFEGKVKEACELQVKNSSLIDALFMEVNPIPVKTALNLMGFDVGDLRRPLSEMTEKHFNVLKKELIANGLIK